MARTTILLDDDLLLKVKQLARAQGTTTTQVIRAAVQAHIQQHGRSRLPSFTSVGRSRRRSISTTAEDILRRKAKRHEGW